MKNTEHSAEYRWDLIAKSERLIFQIFEGKMEKPIFEAEFCLNSKVVKETGRNDLEYWLEMMETKDRVFQNRPRMNISKVIHRVFPVVPDIYDMRMFVEIYRNKGYSYRKVFSTTEEKEIFNIPVKEPERKRRGIARPPRRGMLGSSLRGEILEKDGALVLKGEYRICSTKSGLSIYPFLISENYLYCPQIPPLEEVFREEIRNEISEEDLERFDRAYPSFGIRSYLQYGGKNLLLLLLCPNYHRGMELLAKSGCSVLADHYTEFVGKREPKQYRNVQELVGLPPKFLRKLPLWNLRMCNCLDTLGKIWKDNPGLLDGLQHFSIDLLMFLEMNNVTHIPERESHIPQVAHWDDGELRRVMRYLNQKAKECGVFEAVYTRNEIRYQLYADYLIMCDLVGNCEDGITPSNLAEAHERILLQVHDHVDPYVKKKFERKTAEMEYRRLSSEYGKDAEYFSEDAFLVRIPKQAKELIHESDVLRHCVKTYVEKVANGRTKIVFLRKKETPDVPFATIEIYEGRLIQLKAFTNQKAPADAQEFVRKWAQVKGIPIQTSDMIGNA